VIAQLVATSVQSSNILGSLLVAGLTGIIIMAGNIFGNKQVNDANRKKYEILAENIMDKTCVDRSSIIGGKLEEIIENQGIMNGKIDNNTFITEGIEGEMALADELNGIKKEAMSWSRKNGEVILELVVIKANSMIELFTHLLSEDINKLEVVNVKAEMQVQIIKVKRNWAVALEKNEKEFIKYFYNVSHSQHIDTYFIDLCWLLNPQRKINNINVEKELRLATIKFFRFSLENLLAAWEAYGLDKAKGK